MTHEVVPCAMQTVATNLPSFLSNASEWLQEHQQSDDGKLAKTHTCFNASFFHRVCGRDRGHCVFSSSVYVCLLRVMGKLARIVHER